MCNEGDAATKHGEVEANSRLRFGYGATLVGGGPQFGALEDALAAAPALVCADGGADRIGDLDSLDDPAAWRARIGDGLIRVEEQDSTDFEKCLSRIDAPFFVGVGMLGGRMDHALAALHTVLADPRPIVLVGEDDVVFAAGQSVDVDAAPGERISIFPLRPVTATGGAGLRWPIDGLSFEAGAAIGVSNQANASRVEMRFDRPGAVICAPRARLAAAIESAIGRR
ncbi:MAG: thiamine pyrophosphokinase [Pseudomonadota bacterium]